MERIDGQLMAGGWIQPANIFQKVSILVDQGATPIHEMFEHFYEALSKNMAKLSVYLMVPIALVFLSTSFGTEESPPLFSLVFISSLLGVLGAPLLIICTLFLILSLKLITYLGRYVAVVTLLAAIAFVAISGVLLTLGTIGRLIL